MDGATGDGETVEKPKSLSEWVAILRKSTDSEKYVNSDLDCASKGPGTVADSVKDDHRKLPTESTEAETQMQGKCDPQTLLQLQQEKKKSELFPPFLPTVYKPSYRSRAISRKSKQSSLPFRHRPIVSTEAGTQSPDYSSKEQDKKKSESTTVSKAPESDGIIASGQVSSGKKETNVDCRGVHRGSCTACGCDGYDGGEAGKKCTKCSHPPGKHQNLDLSATTSSSDFVTGQSGDLSSASASTFSITPNQFQGLVPALPFSPPYVLPPMSMQSSTQFPMSPTIANSQQTLDLPEDQRCKVPGCRRPRYQELGPNGKLHEFCGRTHALLYQQLHAGDIAPELKCKTHGCPRQKCPLDDGSGGYYDYCSTMCRDQSRFMLSSAALGTCLLDGCNRPKYRDPANGRIHDYCGRTHAYQARKQGVVVPPMSIKTASQQEYKSVEAKFQQKWAKAKGACPPMTSVFVVTNDNLKSRWEAYRQSLSDKTVEEHYHGTKLKCDITNTKSLCNHKGCGVCGISSMGMDRRCIRQNINFQRFGHGFYLAPNSSKCHDYTEGTNGFRAMLLCDVCPGKKYKNTKNDPNLTSPPQGYDSVYGVAGSKSVLNYDEIVLYNPDGILPRFVIVYQKSGDNRLIPP